MRNLNNWRFTLILLMIMIINTVDVIFEKP